MILFRLYFYIQYQIVFIDGKQHPFRSQGQALDSQPTFKDEVAANDGHVEAALAKVKELEALLSLTHTEKVIFLQMQRLQAIIQELESDHCFIVSAKSYCIQRCTILLK